MYDIDIGHFLYTKIFNVYERFRGTYLIKIIHKECSEIFCTDILFVSSGFWDRKPPQF